MINNIFKNFKDSIKGLDKLTKRIMKNGLKFSSLLGIIALIVLITYNLSLTTPIVFTLGFVLLKLSFTFGVEFIICGVIVDKIKAGVI